MLRLNQFLEPLMRRLDLYQPCRERAVLVIWPEVVGPYVASNTAAVAIKRGVLFVRTASGAWMTELNVGYRLTYIDKLNQRLGDVLVKDIRFLPPPLPRGETERSAQAEALPVQPLQAEDEALIEEVIATVEAPELRHRLRRLMRRDRALRRARLHASWRPCPQCGILTADGRTCVLCAENARRTRLAGLRRMLLRAPWVSPLDARARFPEATLQEYQRIKGALLQSMKKALYDWSRGAPADAKMRGEILGKALRYCMMRHGKRPHELTRQDMCFALGRTLFSRTPE